MGIQMAKAARTLGEGSPNEPTSSGRTPGGGCVLRAGEVPARKQAESSTRPGAPQAEAAGAQVGSVWFMQWWAGPLPA